MAFAKKTSATSEASVVNATNKLKKAIEEVKSASDVLTELGSNVEELQATIAVKEDRIIALDVEFEEKKRKSQVELDLAVKANKEQLATQILTEQGKEAIEKADLAKLKNAFGTLQKDFDTKVATEVTKSNTALQLLHEQKIALLNAEFKTTEANNLAKLTSQSDQIKYLTEANVKLEKTIDAERLARIEIAKAGSIGSINVSAPSK